MVWSDWFQNLFRTLLRNRQILLLYKHGSRMDWKNWENGKTFSSQGILNRLEKSGNFTQNIGKMGEFD